MGKFPRDAREMTELYLARTALFYVAFLRVLRYVATRNLPPSPSPFSKGDYFLLICITPRPTKGARDRPCHCNVNKLRLPDLLPRGGHASSFVIAPPLSLYCNAETSTGRQTFFTNPTPRFALLSLTPLPLDDNNCSQMVYTELHSDLFPRSDITWRNKISVVILEFSASYRGETM